MKNKFMITNESGLHARPASVFVNNVKSYQSDVIIRKNGKEANGKSLMRILTLGISKGDTIEIEVSGPDEKEAMAAIQNLIDSGLEG
ncbi:phosphocarrier protein [Melghiribacillus thermohalophilus]|uniref:Phosphocarrier protein HPr n=1 Tax=Melghiribacillus thermohalophilus TaxID=1324956 RepID=A0A4R3MQ11_9BACI|nr:HPr family phosphocarrier protein [Melghiribacillus thermohalophilus]TCT17569.1 phosphocarrier protein [Melghiribacillus thermohalophilus]